MLFNTHISNQLSSWPRLVAICARERARHTCRCFSVGVYVGVILASVFLIICGLLFFFFEGMSDTCLMIMLLLPFLWFCMFDLYGVHMFNVEVSSYLSTYVSRVKAYCLQHDSDVGSVRPLFVSTSVDGVMFHINYVSHDVDMDGNQILVLGVVVRNDTPYVRRFNPESWKLFTMKGGQAQYIEFARYDSLFSCSLEEGETLSGTLCFVSCEPSRIEYVAANKRLVRLFLGSFFGEQA